MIEVYNYNQDEEETKIKVTTIGLDIAKRFLMLFAVASKAI
jgi:hypothetical protein